MFLKHLVCILIMVNVIQADDEENYSKIIEALDKGLTYILNNPRAFNVDGLFGVTFVVACLNTINKIGYYDRFSNEDIINLEKKSQQIFKTIYPLLETEGTDELFRQVLLNPGLLDKTINFKANQLNTTYEKRAIKSLHDLSIYYMSTGFTEALVDKCFAQLINSKNPNGLCHLDKECQNAMIKPKPDDAGYVTSHKLLMLIMFRMLKCIIPESGWYKDNIMLFCNDMLWEVRTMARLEFPKDYNDLMLEHITLCGYQGFAEFFNETFMDAVFEMQTSNGCFSPKRKSNRIKRKANLDTNGCVDHTNGLGVATLALYLRYLLIGY